MDDLRIGPRLTIPADELQLAFARSAGPGGQKVNKAETKVEVRWKPSDSRALSEDDRRWLLRALGDRLTADGELIVTSQRTRTQAGNRKDALDKLAELLRQALVRPKRRRPTRPSKGSVERRLKAKKERSKLKQNRRAPPD